jgi:hypothetical protein
MSAADLLTTLRSRGLTLAADGDALAVRPRDLLTDELREAIRAHKRDLLAELPRYRCLILEPAGGRREICVLPEMTAAALAPCYPGARLVALPDSAVDARTLMDESIESEA